MSAVYKKLTTADKPDDEEESLQTAPKSIKQRVLVLSSRGVTYRQRHLLNDLAAMLPHGRKDAKLDSKSKLYHLNEVAELYNCNNILYFEARKRQDLYCWMAKAPNGPSVKMHVQNLHTMEELHFTGNALRGSRPVLSFDASFSTEPHALLLKELLTHTFGVPRGTRKSKPFIDHVLSFTLADGKVWFRNYQIAENMPSATTAATSSDDTTGPTPTAGKGAKSATDLSLIEIGPRFVLTPIVILEGAFGGPVIYENKEFVSPNAVRAELRNRRANKYNVRSAAEAERAIKKRKLGLDSAAAKEGGKDALDGEVLFA